MPEDDPADRTNDVLCPVARWKKKLTGGDGGTGQVISATPIRSDLHRLASRTAGPILITIRRFFGRLFIGDRDIAPILTPTFYGRRASHATLTSARRECDRNRCRSRTPRRRQIAARLARSSSVYELQIDRSFATKLRDEIFYVLRERERRNEEDGRAKRAEGISRYLMLHGSLNS